MNKTPTVYDVFRTQGQPTYTYVEREGGVYERKLRESIQNKGTVCLVTGPSKTGKTRLYTSVATALGLEILIARCSDDLSAKDVWKKALEDVNFERLSSRQRKKVASSELSGEVGGSIGWHWLAGLTGKAGGKVQRSRGEDETRERVLADPTPDHLVKLLGELPIQFVLEDFHYLTSEVQRTLFQQWKTFSDNRISVVIVGTTHHAVDLAYANKDLIGRLTHIDVPTWNSADLSKIAEQGFAVLNVDSSRAIAGTIAAESVGLPIVTQAVCLQILLKRGGE